MGNDQPRCAAEVDLIGQTLLIRADASTQIGSGHVMRCLALAQAWQAESGKVTFLSALPEALRTRLEAAGMSVRPVTVEPGTQDDAHQVIALAQELETPYVVVDGYHFGAEYQQWIKAAGLRLLFLDDNGHAGHYCADWVLNQNIHATEKLYSSRESTTRLLLGTRYTLLRREFWPWRDWKREIPGVARKVLVTLGGSDPDNVTLKVLRALEYVEVDHLEVKVIAGSSNPHREALRAAVSQSAHNIQLEQDVSDMPALMAWADAAVSAGGSTCWELAFMGLPAVILVLADNQRAAAERLGEQGSVIDLGWHGDLTPPTIAQSLALLLENLDRRTQMSLRGRELVDSRGGERVIEALRQRQLSLRPVTPQDRELLWQWANDPAVRQSAFNPEPIPWDDHVRWFARKQKDPGCHHFIAFDEQGHPVGQIRFDRIEAEEHDVEVDVSISSSWRGCGYGALLIRQGVELLCQLIPVRAVHALVRIENTSSLLAFQKMGFKDFGTMMVQGSNCKHLIWESSNTSSAADTC